MNYDLAIIGGGPAGVAAGIYAARKQLRTVLVAEAIGGQSIESQEIQNWIGTEKISGADLAHSLERHLRAYAGNIVELHIGERAEKVEKVSEGFSITTGKGAYTAKALLIATGGSRRKLDIPGASEFENKGLTYCASCDGPLFAGQDVVVVGGGNAGFETAAQLLAYCKSVTLLHRGEDCSKADPLTYKAVTAHPNMKVLLNTEPVKIVGKQFVEEVAVKNRKTGEESTVPASGVFVEIGMIPSTGFAKGVVELDGFGRVVVNPKNQRAYVVKTPAAASDARHGEGGDGDVIITATETQGPRNEAGGADAGVWAAGDCTDELYHQNNIAAGDAVKALEDIYFWLKSH